MTYIPRKCRGASFPDNRVAWQGDLGPFLDFVRVALVFFACYIRPGAMKALQSFWEARRSACALLDVPRNPNGHGHGEPVDGRRPKKNDNNEKTNKTRRNKKAKRQSNKHVRLRHYKQQANTINTINISKNNWHTKEHTLKHNKQL